MANKRVAVVDNFYTRPERVREYARNCEWLAPESLGPNFPGIESRRSFFSEALVARFEALIGGPIEVNQITLPFGIFALGFAEHERNKVVHIDPCEWTGVVYLTAPDAASGGTALYRNRRTGLTEVPPLSELQRRGYKSRHQFFSAELGSEQRNPDAWELDTFVEMKFNRLVLFRAPHFTPPQAISERRSIQGGLSSCFSSTRSGSRKMQSIIVVDDFFSRPDRIREIALRVEYVDVRGLNYPGFQSKRAYFSEALKTAFSELTGEMLRIDPANLTFGKFRVMLEATGSRLKVHLDSAADWTGLIYLNLPAQCEGGTAFFRHKATGLEGQPSLEEAARFGFTDVGKFEEQIIEPDTLRTDAWQQTTFVAMKYNRLVLFRGSELFHGHTSSWGRTVAEGRLTQNFFFDSLTRPREGLVYQATG